jgi:DNA-binding CsgD family transcriptional regulator
MTTIKRTKTGYQLNHIEAGGLSPRECQILLMRCHGMRNKECARELNCSEANIKNRVVNIFYKLKCHNMNEAITKALHIGYLRFMSLFVVSLIAMSFPTADNQQYLTRNGKPARTQQSRTQRRREIFDMESFV